MIDDMPETVTEMISFASNAATSLILVFERRGLIHDPAVRAGFRNGKDLVDMLIIGRDAATKSTFSVKTMAAEKLLAVVRKSEFKAEWEFSKDLDEVKKATDRLVTDEISIVEASVLLEFFERLTEALIVTTGKPMGCL